MVDSRFYNTFSGVKDKVPGRVNPKRVVSGVLLLAFLLWAAPGVTPLHGASFESGEQALYEEGLALNEMRRFDDALIRFKEAISTELETHKYHNAIFVTYISTRRGLTGVSYYEDLREKNPKSPAVHYWLGRFYLASGALGKAEEVFEAATGLNPDDEHPWISLGHVQLRLGKNAQALRAYEEAERLVPGIPIVQAGIGKIYFDRKQYQKARVEYEQALEKDPGLLEARYELSLIYEKQKEFGKAVSEWKSILVSDPNELRSRDKLARIYFQGEQYADSVREFSLLSRLLPNDPKVYLGLGEAQVMLASTIGEAEGRKLILAQAGESFQHALDFDPGNETAEAYLKNLSGE